MSKVRLGDVAVEARETIKDPSGLPVVGLEHLIPGEIELTQWAEGNENTFTKAFYKGQILFGRRRAYQKKASVATIDGVCSGDITVIAAMEDRILPELLPFVVNDDRFFDYAMEKSAGSLSPRVKWVQLAEYEFELPDDFDKQKELADLLWAMERTRKAYKELLLQADDLVKSQFIEMFGDIKTNERNWTIKPLKELCEITRGGSPRPIADYLGGDIPWIKIGDATDGDNIYINSTKEHIIEAGVKKSRYIKAGSLIFANCGVSLGFCRIINFDGCIHDGWLALQDINESLDKVFLLMTINQQTEYFRGLAPGSTQPNLNTEIMGNYRQIIPPMRLQKEYIEFIKQTDKSKLAIKDSLDSLEKSRSAIMKQIFG